VRRNGEGGKTFDKIFARAVLESEISEQAWREGRRGGGTMRIVFPSIGKGRRRAR
jgi:hypothetical protein